MARSKIEWLVRPGTTPESWNPVTGCTKISEGCRNCYAERMARRLAGRFGYPAAPNHFDVTLRPDRLDELLRWKKPRTVFVCSMGDLFHEDVPTNFIHRVFDNMFYAPSHVFLVLTKRPQRMMQFMDVLYHRIPRRPEPIQNIWLGVTVENQRAADERVPLLLRTPAVVRFVSCEPLLEKVDLSPYLPQECAVHNAVHRNGRDCLRPRDDQPVYLDWVIVGGESGPGARPMHPDWVRNIRDQCQAVGVAFFYKQVIINGKKISCPELDGRQWKEMPNV